ncbi:sulfotransferase family 2 domain-containing protein [Profundibacter sp.]
MSENDHSPSATTTPSTFSRMVRFASHRLSPLSQRHVIYFPEAKIAYFRVPKAANSSTRTLLAQTFGMTVQDGVRPAMDFFWIDRSEATSLTLNQFCKLRKNTDIWSFSFVRHPVTRLYSCWNNKVLENSTLSPSFLKMGITSGMKFADFVARVAKQTDKNSDIHVRSMSSILTAKGKLLPDFIGRVETIDTDWEVIRAEILRRSGIEAGPMLRRNMRGKTDLSIVDSLTNTTLKQIETRYSEDYERFYPDG